jgi:osmotically-inducible protein OsmY
MRLRRGNINTDDRSDRRRQMDEATAEFGGYYFPGKCSCSAIASTSSSVKPRVRAEDVRGKIRAAPERNAEIDADRITVTVSGGNVTLASKIIGWTEREPAERQLGRHLRVTDVEDRVKLARPLSRDSVGSAPLP